MNHDAFGELTEVAEELWSRKIDVSIFNQTMTFDLYVDVFEDEGVQEVQVQAFEQFNGDWAKTCPSVEQALLAYYQSICEQYRDQLADGYRLSTRKGKDYKIPDFANVGRHLTITSAGQRLSDSLSEPIL